MRIVLALFLSPLIGMCIYQLIVVISIFGVTGYDLVRIGDKLVFGIAPLIVLYFPIVVVSVPVFLTTKYFFDWKIFVCLMSAFITTGIIMIFLFGVQFLDQSERPVTIINLQATAILLGILIYGLSFYLLVRGKEK